MVQPRSAPERGVDAWMPRDPVLVATLAEVFATANDALYSEGRDGTITSWNRGAERLFGYAADVAVGLGADSLYPGRLAGDLAVLRRHVHAGEVIENVEFEALRRDGLVVPVRLAARPIRRDGRGVLGAWVTVRDEMEERTAQATLADSAARLEEAEELAHIGMWVWDAAAGVIELSGELYRICGRSPRDFDGTFESYMMGVHREDRTRVLTAMRGAAATGRSFAEEYRVVRPDGDIRWVYARGERSSDTDGLRGVAQDVTERRHAEEELRRQASSLDLLKRLAVAANQALTLEDALWTSVRDICAHTGWSVGHVYLASLSGKEVVATPVWHLDDPESFESLRTDLATTAFCCGQGLAGRVLATRQPAWTTTLDARELGAVGVAAGAVGLRAAFAFPVTVGQQAVAVLEFFSTESTAPDTQLLEVMATASTQLGRVVERSRAEALLYEQAAHDSLTGLPNRSLFLARLEEALATVETDGGCVAVLFIDLDDFKVVNDSLGHAAGDAVVVALSHRIQSVLKPTDTVGRFGGDEFTIVCRGLRREDEVLGIVRRVSDTVALPLALEAGGELVITCSIGIAFGRSKADGAEALLRDADVAMYRAKQQGRARHEIFDTVMHIEAMQRLTTVTHLRTAIDMDQLRLFYQPQYSLADGQLVGAEALIRWERPAKGLTLPDEFIQLAEESQLIVPIGNWVLREACLQTVRWETDEPFKIAVNVSACQLARPDFVETVAGILAETKVDPGSVCFEITESVLMGDADLYVKTLSGVRRLGVSIAVDDFGMGYSSLAYLQRFPVDILKVDKAFVSRLGAGDDQARAVVGAVINLAHALDMTSVAEGVETAGQRQDLIALGCLVGQGYFLGRPQAIADGATWHPRGAGVASPSER